MYAHSIEEICVYSNCGRPWEVYTKSVNCRIYRAVYKENELYAERCSVRYLYRDAVNFSDMWTVEMVECGSWNKNATNTEKKKKKWEKVERTLNTSF